MRSSPPARASRRWRPAWPSGVAAFAASYAVLPVLGVYRPIWEYDAGTLWKDASAHAVFGGATGLALGVIERLGRG